MTVELKNGTVVSGSVAKVDPSMNIHLSKVKMTVRGKNPETLDSLSIRGEGVICSFVVFVCFVFSVPSCLSS